jgi:hypothetical protein
MDMYMKLFRFYADIINDIGLTIDMMSPMVSGTMYYVPIMALAALCRTMCGISAGATKSAISVYFSSSSSSSSSTSTSTTKSTSGNIADLNAKESTQETMVTLLGMYAGVQLAQYLQSLEQQQLQQQQQENIIVSSSSSSVSLSSFYNDHNIVQLIQWMFFFFFTIIHLWANYCAIQVLRLFTLNRPRFRCVCDEIISYCTNQTCQSMMMMTMIQQQQKQQQQSQQYQYQQRRNVTWNDPVSSMANNVSLDNDHDDETNHIHMLLNQLPSPLEVIEPISFELWELLVGQFRIVTTSSLPAILAEYPSWDSYDQTWTNNSKIKDNAMRMMGHSSSVLLQRYRLAITRSGRILVCLLVQSKIYDQVHAMLHAFIIERYLQDCTRTERCEILHNVWERVRLISSTRLSIQNLIIRQSNVLSSTTSNITNHLVHETSHTVPLHSSHSLWECLIKKGWKVEDGVYFGFGRYRYRCNPQVNDERFINTYNTGGNYNDDDDDDDGRDDFHQRQLQKKFN